MSENSGIPEVRCVALNALNLQIAINTKIAELLKADESGENFPLVTIRTKQTGDE
jgi:hypothetical protein